MHNRVAVSANGAEKPPTKRRQLAVYCPDPAELQRKLCILQEEYVETYCGLLAEKVLGPGVEVLDYDEALEGE